MSQTVESYNNTPAYNPLDSVEDVLMDNNWVFDRTNSDELLVDVAGSVFGYRLFFVWQEHMNALQIVCRFDCTIKDENLDLASDALMQVNRSMWMGHFELTETKSSPCFRYTCLLQNHNNDTVYNNIQNIVDICFAQCEQYQSVFQILSSDRALDIQILSLAMMETAGES